MSKATIDHHLLFGALAVQTHLLRREDLMAALTEWARDRSRPLDKALLDRGALTAETRDLLHALVRTHLDLHGADPAQCATLFGPLWQDLSRLAEQGGTTALADADAWATRLPEAATNGTAVDAFATRAPETLTADGAPAPAPVSGASRFRKVRPHARGGLGEVFVALDEELRREVALKEIQDRHADNSGSRARFLLEAEVTGNLEHPGIVPVYGLGQYLDGRPYYAMRFISGDSLQEAIDQFHAADGPARDPAERSLSLRQLLRRFVDTCNAIAYAHSRGILHRDIKPANVMLGKYGETLVVDWGLAKAMDRPEEKTVADEKPVQLSADSSSVQTMAGAVVGTPQFMSPEQAAGRLDILGPASDVYSLGATLYVLLIGQVPVTGASIPELLQKVQSGDIVPPRQVKRSVPPALDAVCRKALALKPAERYATARALADDVEHWLADEPVSAYREPVLVRAGRWMRRHRTAVTAALVALIVAVTGSVGANILLTAANERERAAKELAEQQEREAAVQRDEAQKQRDKARERFRQACEAVDNFYTLVSESPEMQEKGTEKLRTELLESAVAYYQKLTRLRLRPTRCT